MSQAPTPTPPASPNWKFGEFMQLARACGLPDCKEYLDAIMYKVLRFGYHADREKEEWLSLSASGAPVDVASDAFSKAMFAAESRVEPQWCCRE
jgi:hypothetical protein